LARLGPKVAGRACLLCPGVSDINLLGYGESIIHLDAEVAYRALDLRVSQQQLDGALIAVSSCIVPGDDDLRIRTRQDSCLRP